MAVTTAASKKKAAPPKDSGGVKGALTRKFGPLPAWAWASIGGGALWLYRRSHASSSGSTVTTAANDTSGLSSSGYGSLDSGGSGSGGTSGATDPGTVATGQTFDPNALAEAITNDLAPLLTGQSMMAQQAGAPVSTPAFEASSPSYVGPNGAVVTPTTYQSLGVNPDPISSSQAPKIPQSTIDAYSTTPATKLTQTVEPAKAASQAAAAPAAARTSAPTIAQEAPKTQALAKKEATSAKVLVHGQVTN